MKIVFDSLGSFSSSAFIEKDEKQFHIGCVDKHLRKDKYEFNQSRFVKYFIEKCFLAKKDIPTKEQVIEEYKKQLANLNAK